MKYCFTLTFCTCLWLTSIGQKFVIVAPADWVQPIESNVKSQVSKYDVSSGSYFTLVDYQINLKESADYTHLTSKILTNAGITTSSEIYIPYDSSYQNVAFHHLYIWRKGKKIDKTQEITFEFINAEQNLQSSMYTGLVTAYAVLKDIRKEDKIEYAYTVYGDNPIFMDNRHRMINIDYNNPIDHFNLTVMYPKEEDYTYRIENEEMVTINEAEMGLNNVVNVTAHNIEAVEYEETQPPWYYPYNFFSISNMQSWGDVAHWAQEVFSLDQQPNLKDVYDEVITESLSVDEKITALIDYTQNEIRYMGVESGIGSILPFAPEQVVDQRFGDCKDKSLLLVHLLRQIGVDTAHVALVNSSIKKILPKMCPGPIAFNHCITHFIHQGRSYWIDPSIALQGGGYKDKVTPDYGKALIIQQGNNKLVEMEVRDTISAIYIDEEITVPSFEQQAYYKINTKYTGSNADLVRSALEYMSLNDFSDYMKNSYSVLYPNISTKDKIKVKDDITTNTISIVESYNLDHIWNKEDASDTFEKATFHYEPIVLYNYLFPVTCDTKKHPVYNYYPNRFYQKTTLHLPRTLEIKMEKESTDNLAFSYLKDAKMLDDDTLYLEYSYESKTETIPPHKFGDICKEINDKIRSVPLEVFYLLRK